jgi:hypothetical protein
MMKMKLLKLSALLLTMFGILFLSSSCNKDKEEINLDAPKITTKSVHTITPTSAIGGGSVVSEGTSEVTIKGVCWSTSPNPTINDSKTNHGSGKADFDSQIPSLQPSTTYFVRAYATNEHGTGYGEEISFKTL